MIKQGWKEFRALGCRRTILVVYDALWFLGFEKSAAWLLYRELTIHCGISQTDLEEALTR